MFPLISNSDSKIRNSTSFLNDRQHSTMNRGHREQELLQFRQGHGYPEHTRIKEEREYPQREQEGIHFNKEREMPPLKWEADTFHLTLIKNEDDFNEPQSEDGFVRPEDEGSVVESAAAVGETAVAQVASQESRHPWPHLEDYFVFTSKDQRNANVLHFQCVLCLPKEITINGQATSLYNLKSHVRRKHPAHVIQFEERIRAGSCRGKHRQSFGRSANSQPSQLCTQNALQTSFDDMFSQSAGSDIRHSIVDRMMVDLFVDNMIPLHVMESPSQAESQQSQNPWPHLEDYFVFTSKDEKNDKILYFRCVMCQPKEITINGQATSLYNLKSHVRRKHPAHVIQFEERIRAGSTRRKYRQSFGCSVSSPSSQPCSKKARQTIDSEMFAQPDDNGACRSAMDRMIVDLFVDNMLPLNVVESPSFIHLIKMLNPSKTSMSRRTLGRRIWDNHNELQKYLMSLLNDIQWVATTADCWSIHNRSYLGMTAHWLDPKTRTRQHAVLACSRLVGHLTFDVLSQAMLDIHSKFHLQDKVTRTTTDNGKNFVKTFVQFCSEGELSPDVPEASAETDLEVTEDVDMDMDAEDEDVDEVEYISIDAVFNESSCLGLNLPAHMKCAAHTFNLVASVDANGALDCASFKSASRKAMSKAQGLWSLQSRSTVAADIIQDVLKRKLMVPKATKWNSTYSPIIVLNNLLEGNKEAVYQTMTQLRLPTFTDSDICFLTEYAQVMSIVSKALDKIQGEDQAFLGCLLPTIAATVMKLNEVKFNHLVYCSPLIDAILAGIMKRFGPLLGDLECQLAAAFHPKFRLFWLEQYDNSQVSRVANAMATVIETALRETNEEGSDTSSNEDGEDDFFSNITRHRSLKSKAQNMVKIWLEAGSKEVLTEAAFLGEQVFIDLFTRYNTAIPSSAAIEHLFSLGTDNLRAKRATQSDGNFERMMFIKGNQHLVEAMERAQTE